MTTLLLARHAETDAVGTRITGLLPGWHLNPKGCLQAESLARRLSRVQLAAIYTSPLERTVETAEIIAKQSALPILRSPELRELDYGDWSGAAIADLDGCDEWRRFNACRGTARPVGGESMLELQMRVAREMELIRKRHPEQIVLAVSHAEPIRAWITHLLGMPLDFMLRLEIAPASVTAVQLSHWAPKILCINETGELPV
jgi:broad specificity phosphatase PhoE